MKRVRKRLAVALAAAAVAVSCLFATPVVAATGDPVYPESTGGGTVKENLFNTELYLGAWCEPKPTDTQIEKYKGCGFNVMYVGNAFDYNSSGIEYVIRQATKHDLAVVINIGGNRTSPSSLRMQSETNDLWQYGNVYGVNVCDEPLGDASPKDTPQVPASHKTGGLEHNTIYDYILNETNYILDKHADALFETVLAIGLEDGDFGYGSLEAYCEAVLSKLDAKDRVLAQDVYPYRVESGRPAPRQGLYLKKLVTQRQASDEYEVGKRMFYLQMEWDPVYRETISAQEMTYQLYTAMSFGINGFVGYKYSGYWNAFDATDICLRTYYGDTELMWYTQQALEEVKKIDHIYLQFADDWQGIMFFEGSENQSTVERANAGFKTGDTLSSYAGLKGLTATQDTLVGIMKDGEGRDGYMITNQSYSLDRKTDRVRAEFNNATRAMLLDRGEVRTVDLTNGVLEADIAPGQGLFVIPLA